MSFRPIISKPRLFHEWGAEIDDRETHWTSLFYDLIVVAATSAIAEPFEEVDDGGDGDKGAKLVSVSGDMLLEASLKFACISLAWNALNEFSSRFEDESLVGHMCFFFHLFGVAAVASGCTGNLRENWLSLATGIVLVKFGIIIMFVRPYMEIGKARMHSLVRFFSHASVGGAMVLGILVFGEDGYNYQNFLTLLICVVVFDYATMPLIVMLKRSDMLAIHIPSITDRMKELTIIIFGEAIFTLTLNSKKSEGGVYVAMFLTLWLLFALALYEFSILPNVDDHALRRSIPASLLWFYTSIVKQFTLLVTSIGIKRLHFLSAEDYFEVDKSTRAMVVNGMSLTLLSVVLIRSYSFGWGRHPSKNDPPPLWRLKVAWWTTLTLLSGTPLVVDWAAKRFFPGPSMLLGAMGAMMLVLILFEAIISRFALQITSEYTGEQLSPNETTYIGGTFETMTTVTTRIEGQPETGLDQMTSEYTEKERNRIETAYVEDTFEAMTARIKAESETTFLLN